MTAFFITGTDTEIGKTFVTCTLLRRYAAAGVRAVGMKPVAAGLDGHGHNEDVEQLIAAAPMPADRALINPYAFKRAIAPHLAAAEEGRDIRFAPIHAALGELRKQAEVVLVEGVGGFRVPLGPEGDSADLAQTLGLPVILVVGLRLGCINHALLTVEAIAARGLPLAGWVANSVDPLMQRPQENVATLCDLIVAPHLGTLPYQAPPQPDSAAGFVRLP
ncbi:MAG: dethiobiotin synthase [Rhodocyclaceae bacterium]|nr:MAG: dethiobiotin synthase [Rhodocyclaceae bacterium]